MNSKILFIVCLLLANVLLISSTVLAETNELGDEIKDEILDEKDKNVDQFGGFPGGGFGGYPGSGFGGYPGGGSGGFGGYPGGGRRGGFGGL